MPEGVGCSRGQRRRPRAVRPFHAPWGEGGLRPRHLDEEDRGSVCDGHGAVKEVIRGNARVVVAAVERLGPGKRAELRPTGAAAAVGVPGSAAASAPAAAAASAGAAPEESEQPRLPSSASPATAALIAAVGGEIPGGEAPILAPAPRFLDDIDAVILCTGYKPCSSDTL